MKEEFAILQFLFFKQVFVMPKNLFMFRQFSICQEKCAMKVGTDGVLLGAWAEGRAGKILDIGTGSGLVALMLAQRSKAAIVGLDIDEGATLQAKENFDKSPWSSRLKSICGDVNHFYPDILFDEIVSNPPFYKYSPLTSNKLRDQARQTFSLSTEKLILSVIRLLKVDGIFEVVLPYSSLQNFVFKCWENNLFMFRQTVVQTKENKVPKRVLLTFCKEKKKEEKNKLVLLDKNGQRTGAYMAMTGEYYLPSAF